MTELKINGKNRLVDVEEDTPLLWAIRDTVGLTGTKYGCGIQQCGACTVLIGKQPVRSCGITVGEVAGKDITTIEGLADGDDLHPMQQAFHECHALQCGYCTPGMVIAAVSLVDEYDDLDAAGVRVGLDGNLCRCTGYTKILDAVEQARLELQGRA